VSIHDGANVFFFDQLMKGFLPSFSCSWIYVENATFLFIDSFFYIHKVITVYEAILERAFERGLS
jgi:hypothetical protein